MCNLEKDALNGADLSDADLSEADLTYAQDVTGEQLHQA